MPRCDVCEEEFTPPPVPGLETCIEGHVCDVCRTPELPDDFHEAVRRLLEDMDGDIYYDAAEWKEWGKQAAIDNLFALRTHVERLLKGAYTAQLDKTAKERKENEQ